MALDISLNTDYGDVQHEIFRDRCAERLSSDD
jgi:hypothetical protein